MAAVPESSKGMTEEEALHEHCVELTRSAPVVVFIKGIDATVELRDGFVDRLFSRNGGEASMRLHQPDSDSANVTRHLVCDGGHSERRIRAKVTRTKEKKEID